MAFTPTITVEIFVFAVAIKVIFEIIIDILFFMQYTLPLTFAILLILFICIIGGSFKLFNYFRNKFLDKKNKSKKSNK